MNSSIARYPAGLRRLHWLIALLIALAYVFIEQRGIFEHVGALDRAQRADHRNFEPRHAVEPRGLGCRQRRGRFHQRGF